MVLGIKILPQCVVRYTSAPVTSIAFNILAVKHASVIILGIAVC
jgi:hypothetical protein